MVLGPVGNKSDLSGDEGGPRQYRGRDRRTRTIAASTRSPVGRPLSSALVVCGGSLLPIMFLLARGAGLAAVADFVTVFSGLVGVAAGGAALVSWRIVGFARLGWLGAAFIDLGFFSLLQSSLSAFVPGPLAGVEPLTGLTVALGAGWLLWEAVHTPEVDAGLSPLRSLCSIAGGTLLAVGSLSLLSAHGLIPAVVSDAEGRECAGLLAVAMWSGLGAAAWWSRKKGIATSSWSAVVIAMLALAAVARATVPVHAADLVAEGMTFVALAVALGIMASELQDVLGLQNRYLFRLHLDLDDIRRQMIAEHEALEERLHDLRNTVGAIRAADRTLRNYAGRLDIRDQSALAEALSAELNRLQVLVEPLSATVPVDLPLGEVLAPVIATERSYGTDIRLSIGNGRARVNADALVQVVQNLLVNARHYAPDSPVWIEADERDGRVELRVIDHGPGISEREGLAIFSRGVRGASSTGTKGDGLGLFVAARLLTEMGGSIRLGRMSRSGACFVLELLAAGEDSAAHDPLDGHPASATDRLSAGDRA